MQKEIPSSRLFKVLLTLLFAYQLSPVVGQHSSSFLYKDARLSPETRALDLLSRMSLDEKIGQTATIFGWEMYHKPNKLSVPELSEKFKKAVDSLHIGMLWGTLRADPWTQKTLENGLTPKEATQLTNRLQAYAVKHSRWGIPLLLAEECAHGLMAIGSTVFPTGIGQASTWNPDLIEKMAAAISLETRFLGSHISYGPILDLAREPRWSRVEETYGEDSYLVGLLGSRFVSGLQGSSAPSHVDSLHSVATLKHFLAYAVPLGGHNGGPAALGMRALLSDYLPPFEKAVKAGALSIMTSYNSIDGVPSTANSYLLKDILRQQWDFKGFVVSDLGSISGLVSSNHTAGTPAQAASQALLAGVDSDLGGYGYGRHLKDALAADMLPPQALDSAVYHILRLKFLMGLFEHPYRPLQAPLTVGSPQHQALNLEVARQSIVLLKNSILPLQKNIGSIAVIGPNADNLYNQLGDYTAPQDATTVTTVLEGIKGTVSKNTKIYYAKGCSIRDTSRAGFEQALAAARQSDVVIAVMGGSSARDFKTDYQNSGAAIATEDMLSDMENGEGNDRSSLTLLGAQKALLQALGTTGKPIILVLIDGRPMAIPEEAAHATDILQAWYPGARGGQAIAEVLFGEYNPTGRLPISMPKSVGSLPVYYSQPKGATGKYVEADQQPLFPFGYGLSYSRFEYSDLQLSKRQESSRLLYQVDFTVTNRGTLAGTDIQELYLTDETSSVVTPKRQLVGFNRCFLQAGASKRQSILVDSAAFSLINAAYQRVVEPGKFIVALSRFAGDPDALKAELVIP